MAQKKTRAARGEASERAAFTVVLEDLHAKFDVFGEALQLVRADVSELREDVTELRGGLTEVRADIGALRQEARDTREDVSALRHEVGALRQDVDLLKIAVVENVHEIKQLRKAR